MAGRAAAFAYGVLEELRATPIDGGRSMLDEADVISSVSGGSFAAAYYGLFGPETFFTEFPDAVLHRRIERGLRPLALTFAETVRVREARRPGQQERDR